MQNTYISCNFQTVQQNGNEYDQHPFDKTKVIPTASNGNNNIEQLILNLDDMKDKKRGRKEDNESKWKNWFAKPMRDLRLTFCDTIPIITNSIPIDTKTVVIHQYEFQVVRKTSESENGEIVTDPTEKRNVFNRLRLHQNIFLQFVLIYFKL